MGLDSTGPWTALERASPTLFLVGGAGVVTHAAVMGIEAFTSLATPPDVFVTTGHLLALVGLLGLYPSLEGRTPRVSRLAVTLGGTAVLGWTLMTAGQVLVVAGAWSSLNAALPGVFFLGLLGTSILAYGSFGVAAVMSGLGSPMVKLLVFAPGVLMGVLLVDSAVTGLTALDGLLIGGALGVSMVALGMKLRGWPARSSSTAAARVVTG